MASNTAMAFQRIIAILGAVPAVSAVVGARIYTAQMATVQNPELPAITLHVVEGSRLVDQGGSETLIVQISLWFKQGGKNNATWDEVMALWDAVLVALHEVGGIQSTMKFLRLTNISEGPMIYENDTKILHFPSRWRVRALA